MNLAAITELLEPAVNQKEDAVLRARALWQLTRAYAKAGKVHGSLSGTLADPDPRFQVLGIRLLKDLYGLTNEGLAKIVDFAGKQNASPAVLRECLIALRDVEPPLAKDALYKLMKRYNGKDRFYLEAIGIAVGPDQARRDVLLADFGEQFPDWNEKVANLIWELRPPQVLPRLEQRLFDTATPTVQRSQIVDILASSADAGGGKILLRVLQAGAPAEVRDRILANLKQFLPGKWRDLRTGQAQSGSLLLNSYQVSWLSLG